MEFAFLLKVSQPLEALKKGSQPTAGRGQSVERQGWRWTLRRAGCGVVHRCRAGPTASLHLPLTSAGAGDEGGAAAAQRASRGSSQRDGQAVVREGRLCNVPFARRGYQLAALRWRSSGHCMHLHSIRLHMSQVVLGPQRVRWAGQAGTRWLSGHRPDDAPVSCGACTARLTGLCCACSCAGLVQRARAGAFGRFGGR